MLSRPRVLPIGVAPARPAFRAAEDRGEVVEQPGHRERASEDFKGYLEPVITASFTTGPSSSIRRCIHGSWRISRYAATRVTTMDLSSHAAPVLQREALQQMNSLLRTAKSRSK